MIDNWMKKELSVNRIALCIVVLFVTVCFQPVFAVENSSFTGDTLNENDCGCGFVGDVHLIRFEKLLNKLEYYIKKLSMLFKDNPRIIEKCDDLSKSINVLKILNDKHIFICLFLWIYYKIIIYPRYLFLKELFGKVYMFPYFFIFKIIISDRFIVITLRMSSVIDLLRDYNCIPSNFSQLNSLI